MMKRVLYKGAFFTEWDGPLAAIAETAGVSMDDLAFHPDDALAEVQELRRQRYRYRAGPVGLGRSCQGDQRALSAPPVLSVLIIVTNVSFLLRSPADVRSR